MATAGAREVVVRRARLLEHRRPRAWAVATVLAALPATAMVALPATSARADITSVPGTMSTAAQNTSTFAVPVPAGVEPKAITGVLTMPEVVEGGSVVFTVNGRVVEVVPSTLYQKVRIPVDPPDVIADGTIGLTMTTQGPVVPGATCFPAGGVASLRKIELDYRGAEVAPTTVSTFFPPASAGIFVVIPADADAELITAGLTAVAALAYRYDDDTPIELAVLNVSQAPVASATQRVVALVEGEAGEVTTAVTTSVGIPLLTLTGSGESLIDAARALSTDALGLSGTDAENPSQQTKPRSTARTRTFDDLGVDAVTLTGYGSTSHQFELRQDSFGVPVSTMDLHLEGSHTAFAEASGARLDVRANGALVDSTVLGNEATFDLDVRIPAGKLRSVNELDLTLTALAPDGSACTPPSLPPAEVDLDTAASTVTVDHGTGLAQGFQLFPQVFEGTIPVALRSGEGRQASAAVNAAALIAVLQRAAGSPLEIQLMAPDAFLADDRSGLMVGALNADSIALDAPLQLSATRLLDREDSTVEVTSQDPYAALESVDRNNRLVLMLGSWAPGNRAAPGELARKVVDAVVSQGWDQLDGDLVIADAANPAFVTASRSLAPHQVVEEEKSYARWFGVAIGLLLLLLALQVVIAIRRDRKVARGPDDYPRDGAAFVDNEEYDVDELGDVDDLDVQEYGVEPPIRRDDDPVPDEYADEADEDYDAFEEWDEDVDDEAYEADADEEYEAGDTDEAADEGLDEDESTIDDESYQPDDVAAEDLPQQLEIPFEEAAESEDTPPRRRWSDRQGTQQPDPNAPTIDALQAAIRKNRRKRS